MAEFHLASSVTAFCTLWLTATEPSLKLSATPVSLITSAVKMCTVRNLHTDPGVKQIRWLLALLIWPDVKPTHYCMCHLHLDNLHLTTSPVSSTVNGP